MFDSKPVLTNVSSLRPRKTDPIPQNPSTHQKNKKNPPLSRGCYKSPSTSDCLEPIVRTVNKPEPHVCSSILRAPTFSTTPHARKCMLPKLNRGVGAEEGGMHSALAFCESLVARPAVRSALQLHWRFLCVSSALSHLQTAAMRRHQKSKIQRILFLRILRRLGTSDNAITRLVAE